MKKNIFLIILILISYINFSNASNNTVGPYDTLEECTKIRNENNNKSGEYQDYERSECYSNNGIFEYLICQKGEECSIKKDVKENKVEENKKENTSNKIEKTNNNSGVDGKKENVIESVKKELIGTRYSFKDNEGSSGKSSYHIFYDDKMVGYIYESENGISMGSGWKQNGEVGTFFTKKGLKKEDILKYFYKFKPKNKLGEKKDISIQEDSSDKIKNKKDNSNISEKPKLDYTGDLKKYNINEKKEDIKKYKNSDKYEKYRKAISKYSEKKVIKGKLESDKEQILRLEKTIEKLKKVSNNSKYKSNKSVQTLVKVMSSEMQNSLEKIKSNKENFIKTEKDDYKKETEKKVVKSIEKTKKIIEKTENKIETIKIKDNKEEVKIKENKGLINANKLEKYREVIAKYSQKKKINGILETDEQQLKRLKNTVEKIKKISKIQKYKNNSSIQGLVKVFDNEITNSIKKIEIKSKEKELNIIKEKSTFKEDKNIYIFPKVPKLNDNIKKDTNENNIKNNDEKKQVSLLEELQIKLKSTKYKFKKNEGSSSKSSYLIFYGDRMIGYIYENNNGIYMGKGWEENGEIGNFKLSKNAKIDEILKFFYKK